MIEQVGQGRMRARVERTAVFPRRSVRLLAFVAAFAVGAQLARAQSSADAKQRDRIEQAHRQEGEAILALADAAMAGKSVPLDFDVLWQNDFIKAQRGTFVPFTLIVDASRLNRPAALVYVRAVERSAAKAADRRSRAKEPTSDEVAPQYPVDAIFPVEFAPAAGSLARISRGFSIPPGDYDVYVVLRERVDVATPGPKPKAAVLRKRVSVPDFGSRELTTSTMILADRLTVLKEPVLAEELAERPYAIGQNEITPAIDRVVGKQEELIVVFLVYNPTVTANQQFDLKVEYYFFRKAGPGDKGDTGVAPPAPLQERAGEKYVNHTDPQRFNPALMGGAYDPSGGNPVMAGQVVPLREFQEGEYRLAILITDLVSGRSITRDVHFTVGSQLD